MVPEQALFVYVGGYTRGEMGRGKGEGIYIYRLLPGTGAMEPVGLMADITNPAFMAIARDGKHLYAINDVRDNAGQLAGAVNAYTIDQQTGKLSFLNRQVTQGLPLCHISIDQTGTWALAVSYRGGSASVLPIDAQGRLGAPTAFVQHSGASRVNPQRQEAAHAHSIIADPSNRFALVADLGMDKVVVYRLDRERGALAPHDPPFIASRPGAGPRHQAFHPNGRYFYVVNELDSTVSVLEWDEATGTGHEVQAISTLPHGFAGENYPAEIRVAPSGRFVYASNRGHDSIAIFGVDGRTGKLAARGHVSTQGQWPRNFDLTPAGDLLIAANEKSDTVLIYRVNRKTGHLTPTGHIASVLTPTCVRVLAVR